MDGTKTFTWKRNRHAFLSLLMSKRPYLKFKDIFLLPNLITLSRLIIVIFLFTSYEPYNFDYIFCGYGLSSSVILYKMSLDDSFKNKSILIIENNKKYQKIYPKNRIFIKISSYKAENKSPGVFLHPRSI